MDLPLRHEGNDVRLLGGDPCPLNIGNLNEAPDRYTGQLVGWRPRMLLEIQEDAEIVLEPRRRDTGDSDTIMEDIDVLGALFREELSGFADLRLVVYPLDRLLQADSDEQANHDGGDVDEEVFKGVGGFVGRVDVEHGAGSGGGWRYRSRCG